MNTNLSQLLQRPAWRPGTVAFGLMAVGAFAYGVLQVTGWEKAGWITGGILLALWCNGIEQASAFNRAFRKKVRDG